MQYSYGYELIKLIKLTVPDILLLFTVKFLNFRMPIFFCNLSKIQIKKPNLRILCRKDAYKIANSEDPDQTAPTGCPRKNETHFQFIISLKVFNR